MRLCAGERKRSLSVTEDKMQGHGFFLFCIKQDDMKDREKKDDLSRGNQQGKSNTNNETNKPLPGEYPPSEDIMNRLNTTRVDLDVENFSRTIGPENFNKPNEPVISDANDIVDAPLLATPED